MTEEPNHAAQQTKILKRIEALLWGIIGILVVMGWESQGYF